jgi:hypothetical protein
MEVGGSEGLEGLENTRVEVDLGVAHLVLGGGREGGEEHDLFALVGGKKSSRREHTGIPHSRVPYYLVFDTHIPHSFLTRIPLCRISTPT